MSIPQAEDPHYLAKALLGQAVTTDEGQSLLDNPVPLEYLDSPRLGGGPVFYWRGLHWIAGHKKSGKSWLTTMQALDHIDTGCPSVVIDFENGKARFARRLRELGLRRWPEGLTYLAHPLLPTDIGTWHALVLQLDDLLPGALLTIDSFRSLVGRYGFEVTDPNGVEKLCQPLVQAESLTTNILDHSKMATKSGDKDVAGWNAAKQQLADVVYFVHKTEDYDINRRGEIRLEIVDDRDGRLPALRAWKIGGQGDSAALHFECYELDQPDTADTVC